MRGSEAVFAYHRDGCVAQFRGADDEGRCTH